MLPMVEAKMIARITQQIMIMIFFCSSRQGKKKHVSNDITVQETVLTKGRQVLLNMDRGTKGKGAAEGKRDGSGFWNPECS